MRPWTSCSGKDTIHPSGTVSYPGIDVELKQPPPGSAERVAKMSFASVYPHLLAKVEKKGRTVEELHEVITWFTGYDDRQLEALISSEASYGTFLGECQIHPNAELISGSICGYRVEGIEDPFMQNVRRLDKLIDELAKGWSMEKILRSP